MMPYWIENQITKIETCRDKVGFRTLFCDAVAFAAPNRWDGCGIACFYDPNITTVDGAYDCLRKILSNIIARYEFPSNNMLCAAAYFWLWRIHGRHVHFHADNAVPKDGERIGHCLDKELGTFKWTLFYLFYLDSLSWSFPKCFETNMPVSYSSEPRIKYVYQEVCRQLCGVRSPAKMTFKQRNATEEQYKKICAETKKNCWADRFARTVKTPELVLALSFYANGYASFACKSNHAENPDDINSQFLFNLVDGATRPLVYVPEGDWDARAVFFILAQWLFLGSHVKGQDTLEERIFAVLYLRFYRAGVDEYFGRKSLKKLWDAFSREDKEQTAAKYRRLLIDTRNRAASMWPDDMPSDYPEIDIDPFGEIAFDELFDRTVRTNDIKKVENLLKEAKPREYQYHNAVLWAATHSKSMYEYLSGLKASFALAVHFDTLKDEQMDELVGGWGELAIEEFEWSVETVKTLLTPEAFDLVLKNCTYLLTWGVNKSPVDIRKIKAYLDYLGLDPDGSHGALEYNDKHPPVYEAVEQNNIELLKLLIEYGATVNCGGARKTSLGLAAFNGNVDIIKVLLNAGADPNLAAINDYTPLSAAVEADKEDSMRLLIQAGADPSKISHFVSNNSEYAAAMKKMSKISKLHQAGEDVAWFIGNIIPTNLLPVHYYKSGHWRMDEEDPEEYRSVPDYAKRHPEYVFTTKEGEPCVGIHDPLFMKQLGAGVFTNAHKGGAILTINDDEFLEDD